MFALFRFCSLFFSFHLATRNSRHEKCNEQTKKSTSRNTGRFYIIALLQSERGIERNCKLNTVPCISMAIESTQMKQKHADNNHGTKTNSTAHTHTHTKGKVSEKKIKSYVHTAKNCCISMLSKYKMDKIINMQKQRLMWYNVRTKMQVRCRVFLFLLLSAIISFALFTCSSFPFIQCVVFTRCFRFFYLVDVLMSLRFLASFLVFVHFASIYIKHLKQLDAFKLPFFSVFSFALWHTNILSLSHVVMLRVSPSFIFHLDKCSITLSSFCYYPLPFIL